MVAMSRRERMVAHDIVDAPFLLTVMVRRRTFLSRAFVDRVLRDVIERCANRRIRGEAMSRGGSFDRSIAGLELCVGWRKRREVGLSSAGRTRAASGTRRRRPSILESNLVPTVVLGQGGVGKAQSAKASSMVLTSPATRSTRSPSITARIVRMSFFAIPLFFGVDIAYMARTEL